MVNSNFSMVWTGLEVSIIRLTFLVIAATWQNCCMNWPQIMVTVVFISIFLEVKSVAVFFIYLLRLWVRLHYCLGILGQSSSLKLAEDEGGSEGELSLMNIWWTLFLAVTMSLKVWNWNTGEDCLFPMEGGSDSWTPSKRAILVLAHGFSKGYFEQTISSSLTLAGCTQCK